MEVQLTKSGIETEYVKNIDLSWAVDDISRLIKQYANDEYILLFPFCSRKLPHKKWPHFKELVIKLKQMFKNKYPILLAPGPNEIDEANNLNAKVVLEYPFIIGGSADATIGRQATWTSGVEIKLQMQSVSGNDATLNQADFYGNSSDDILVPPMIGITTIAG